MVGWRWVGPALLATLFLVLVPVPAHAVAYIPGVRIGDWAQYDVQVLGNRHLFQGPFGLGSFANTQYSRINVTMVTGTSVTLSETIHYFNGTDYLFTTFMVNVSVTEPNFLIAAGLDSPDVLAPGSSYQLNSTETQTILGSTRVINHLNEYSDSSGVTFNEAWAWDRASGFLVGVVLSLGRSGDSETVTFAISKTNLWITPTIFGLTPTLFYGIFGVTLASLAAILGWPLSRFSGRDGVGVD